MIDHAVTQSLSKAARTHPRRRKTHALGLADQLSSCFTAATSAGLTAESRSKEYERSVRASFEALRAIGFRLSSPRNIRSKHLIALAQHWERCGCAASTLRVRVAALRWFCYKINKPGLVRDELFVLDRQPDNRPTVQPQRILFSEEQAQKRFLAHVKIDTTFAHLVWLQDRTGALRSDCLRSTGADVGSLRWPCIELKSKRLRQMELSEADAEHAEGIARLVAKQHGCAARALGWSGGPYAREHCPKLASDLRRWKYWAKVAASGLAKRGDQ